MVDEHFLVWFQMETLSDFYKLYGKVGITLQAGVPYTITIQNNYDSKQFGVNKYIYFTETSNFGGKGVILPWIFIGGACQLALLIFTFIICYFVKIHGKKREGDEYIASLKY